MQMAGGYSQGGGGKCPPPPPNETLATSRLRVSHCLYCIFHTPPIIMPLTWYCRSGFDCNILLITNTSFFITRNQKELVERICNEYDKYAPSVRKSFNRLTAHAFLQVLFLPHIQLSHWDWNEPSSILQFNSQPANTKGPGKSLWLAILTLSRYGILLIVRSLTASYTLS